MLLLLLLEFILTLSFFYSGNKKQKTKISSLHLMFTHLSVELYDMAHLKRFVLVFFFDMDKNEIFWINIQMQNDFKQAGIVPDQSIGLLASFYFIFPRIGSSSTFKHFSRSAITHKKIIKLIESANAINHIFKTCNWN